MIVEEPHDCPFESVPVDFFKTARKSIFVHGDQLSGWPGGAECGNDTTTSTTIKYFHRFFGEHGVPVRLCTDGGPQFTSHDFQYFLCKWVSVSSLHYPQSNGHAEASHNESQAIWKLERGLPPWPSLTEKHHDRMVVLQHKCCKNFLYIHLCQHTQHPSKLHKITEDCDRRIATRTQDTKTSYDAHTCSLPPLDIGSLFLI